MIHKNRCLLLPIAVVLLILPCSLVAGLEITVDCNLCLYRRNPTTHPDPLTNPPSCFNDLEVGTTNLIAPFPVSGNTYLSSFTYFTAEGSECNLCLLAADSMRSSGLIPSRDFIKDLIDGLGSFKFCVKSGTVDCEKPEEEEEEVEEEEGGEEEEEEEEVEEEEEEGISGSLGSDSATFGRPRDGSTTQSDCSTETNFQFSYEVHEFNSGLANRVTASLCPGRGGSVDFDAILIIYQAPGGAEIPNFTLTQTNGCQNFVAMNDDGPASEGCSVGGGSYITTNIVPGFFYVAITANAPVEGENNAGKYRLSVDYN